VGVFRRSDPSIGLGTISTKKLGRNGVGIVERKHPQIAQMAADGLDCGLGFLIDGLSEPPAGFSRWCSARSMSDGGSVHYHTSRLMEADSTVKLLANGKPVEGAMKSFLAFL
jgi:hypothetical protein